MQHSLPPLAEEEIASLESEGVALTPHDIIHLAALAHEVMSPSTRQELARGRPVVIGDAVLWPLTLSASDWWERVGQNLDSAFARVGIHWAKFKRQMISFAYALAHGSEPLPEHPKEAVRAIAKWRREKLHCTLKELQVAISLIQEQDVSFDAGDKDAPATQGQIAAALTSLTGTRPQVWEFQCSMGFTIELIELIAAQCQADGKSIRDAQSTKALKALALAANRIRERHNREQAKNG